MGAFHQVFMILELIDSFGALATVILVVEEVALVAGSVGVLDGGPLILLFRLHAVVDGEEDRDEEQDAHCNNDPDPHHVIIIRATVFRIDRFIWVHGFDRIWRWCGYCVSGLFFFVRLSAEVTNALERDGGRRGHAALRKAYQAVSHVENAHKLLEEDVAEVKVALLCDIEHSVHFIQSLDTNAAVRSRGDIVISLQQGDGQVESGHVDAE